MIAIETKLIVDEARRRFSLSTEFDQSELVSLFRASEFYAAIYRQVATKVADKMLQKIGPAIDKAMDELRFEGEADNEQ